MGSFFRTFSGGYNRVDLNKNEKMFAGVFLFNFRQNLANINKETFLYGRHSSRRGELNIFTLKDAGIFRRCAAGVAGAWNMTPS